MMNTDENKSSGCPVEESVGQTQNAAELEPRQESAPTSVEYDGSGNAADNPPAPESKTKDQDSSLEACKSNQENASEESSTDMPKELNDDELVEMLKGLDEDFILIELPNNGKFVPASSLSCGIIPLEWLEETEYNLIQATGVFEQREDDRDTWNYTEIYRRANRLKKLILTIRQEAQRIKQEESCDSHNAENYSESSLSADLNFGLIPLHSCIWYTCSTYENLIEYLRQTEFGLEEAKKVLEKLKGRNHNQWSSAMFLPIIDRLWEQILELCSGVQRLERKEIGCPVEEGAGQTPNAAELEPRQESAPTSVENDGGSDNAVDNLPAPEFKAADQEGSLEAYKSDQENTSEGSGVENEGEKKRTGILSPKRAQWYNQNPTLFKAELAVMKRYFPKAKYKILESGEMVWCIRMHISRTGFCKPWTFLLRFEPDHPNSHIILNLHILGGSVQVLLYDPGRDELIERAKTAGRPWVPSLSKGFDKLGNVGKSFTRLHLLLPQSLSDTTRVISAAAWAAMAAKWALCFEIGLRDVDFWNQWCDYEYSRNLAVKTDNAGEVQETEGILSEDQREEIQQLTTALRNKEQLWLPFTLRLELALRKQNK